MVLLILIIAVVFVYFVIGISKDKDAERQRKQDSQNSKSIENYTTKKNLFLLYGNYLYENIETFKKNSNYELIKKMIENNFPSYSGGISGFGIIDDFSDFDLLKIRVDGKTKLGKTFQIISIAYENFIEFSNEIYNSDYVRRLS